MLLMCIVLAAALLLLIAAVVADKKPNILPGIAYDLWPSVAAAGLIITGGLLGLQETSRTRISADLFAAIAATTFALEIATVVALRLGSVPAEQLRGQRGLAASSFGFAAVTTIGSSWIAITTPEPSHPTLFPFALGIALGGLFNAMLLAGIAACFPRAEDHPRVAGSIQFRWCRVCAPPGWYFDAWSAGWTLLTVAPIVFLVHLVGFSAHVARPLIADSIITAGAGAVMVLYVIGSPITTDTSRGLRVWVGRWTVGMLIAATAIICGLLGTYHPDAGAWTDIALGCTIASSGVALLSSKADLTRWWRPPTPSRAT